MTSIRQATSAVLVVTVLALLCARPATSQTPASPSTPTVKGPQTAPGRAHPAQTLEPSLVPGQHSPAQASQSHHHKWRYVLALLGVALAAATVLYFTLRKSVPVCHNCLGPIYP